MSICDEMTTMYEPKLGDVVALKSDPTFPMTVVGYDRTTKLYGVIWLDAKARPHCIQVDGAAVSKWEKKEDAPDPDTQRAVAMASETIIGLTAQLDEERGMREALAKREAGVAQTLRSLIPRESWSDSVEDMASDAARRFETYQREANEQLARLSTRVKELGG